MYSYCTGCDGKNVSVTKNQFYLVVDSEPLCSSFKSSFFVLKSILFLDQCRLTIQIVLSSCADSMTSLRMTMQLSVVPYGCSVQPMLMPVFWHKTGYWETWLGWVEAEGPRRWRTCWTFFGHGSEWVSPHPFFCPGPFPLPFWCWSICSRMLTNILLFCPVIFVDPSLWSTEWVIMVGSRVPVTTQFDAQKSQKSDFSLRGLW